MGPDQQRLTSAERANLVAYLDGELNEAEAQAIATKLTKSVIARREIEVLEKTWELLDHLPRARVSEDFTARTLTEVERLTSQDEHFDSVLKQTTERVIRITVWVLASLLAFGGGYLATNRLWPNPVARLVRDLSIAEHLEEYREVGDFELLQALAHSPEFGSDTE